MRAAALLLFAGSAAAGTSEPTFGIGGAPTVSPACPVGLSIDYSGPPFQCGCDIVDANTVPFNDVAHTYCPGTMPSEFNGAIHLTCPHCLRNDTQFNITCPNSWAACDIYLLVYHCPSCFSSRFNGGWVQNLGPEWASKRCAPNFCRNGDQALSHQMISFNYQVLGGTEVPLPATTTSKSYYFSMIVKELSGICSDNDMGNCTGPACVWDTAEGKCVNAFCPPADGGGPGCTNCAPPDCATVPPMPPVTGPPMNVRSGLPPGFRVESKYYE
eukprot:TRINITY_DN2633_c0_g1_i2.p1 TRINITY_DN2633_c0_g1~~TRINITY_DN2633_c0_g1_i2.p1  ORF type:complete len:301 (+),score=96.92 TRINITY_DN2633_c0_g1_i2:93-905(+)